MLISKRTAFKTLAAAATIGLPLLALKTFTPKPGTTVAGFQPGQRKLNGPQNTGRPYRNLSMPEHTVISSYDIEVPMRDGVTLRVDVYRPQKAGRYPVLVAASPYPRQMQDLGAPLGIVEAGATDYFVPRGYVHVIASLRGTGGSGGTFGFFDAQERHDMYDLIEWAALQDWSDGNVGMLGISYFAMTQYAAAVEQPPHLKAIFPLQGTVDLFTSASHHGLVSASFVTPFLAMVGMTSSHTSKFWRSSPLNLLRRILHIPSIHKRFESANGEAAMTGLRVLLKLPHDAHPWDELWRSIVVEHPLRDSWWDERDLRPLLGNIKIPVYSGCDWDNVPLHLPSTYLALEGMKNSPHVQVAMTREHGFAWPWESMHEEALAWYDHWLKGRDTGILEGPKFRYQLPQAEGWRTSESWPLKDTSYQALALCADGKLKDEEGVSGKRTLMSTGAGLVRSKPSKIDPPSSLSWTTEPLHQDLDMVGYIELQLDAISTASDTAWIVMLQDVDTQGQVHQVTAGYLRASLRTVDEEKSRVGAPVLPCRTSVAVPVGEVVRYRIPIVGNARRFKAGHSIRLFITSDDQDESIPSMLTFRHASVGTSSINSVLSSSRLLLPTTPVIAP